MVNTISLYGKSLLTWQIFIPKIKIKPVHTNAAANNIAYDLMMQCQFLHCLCNAND